MNIRINIRRSIRVVVLVASFASVCTGCGSGADYTKPVAGGTGAGQTPVAPSDPLILTSAHPGWKMQLCLSCHGQSAPYPHTVEGYVPPKCVSCHGYNGAPHRNHATLENTGCKDCHGDVSHTQFFKAPDDCVVCHYHPEQP